VLVLCFMVAYPFPSAATEALVECSTERVRRLSPISTPKDDTSDCFQLAVRRGFMLGERGDAGSLNLFFNRQIVKLCS